MEERDVHAELTSIRELMERSSKFISLSGWSGILAGLFALAGAGWAYTLIRHQTGSSETEPYLLEDGLVQSLFMIALAVFVMSVVTSYWLTMRKAKSRNEHVWNPVSRRMLAAIAIPMVTGGLYIAGLVWNGQHGHIASGCLIFYGLALVAGSQYTLNEVKWLGIGEILLGLLALILPGYGLILWAIGFGLLHILYGTIMHFKYEK